MTTQAQRRQDTRRRILSAAGKLFRAQGFDKTSVDQIVAAAEVAKGTFYQYFQAKIDVALALGSEAQQQSLEEIRSKLAAGQSPLAVGGEFLQSTADWVEKNRGIARPLSLHALEKPRTQTPSSMRAMLALVFAAARKKGEIRTDLPAEHISELLVGNLALTVLHWTMHGKRGQLAGWLGFAWKLHLEGALPR
ncbi:MAG: TetR/AcrR family transcriptional regulator [Bryobacteraceae bacterium]|jgi:AcrR family transcriptional regulator